MLQTSRDYNASALAPRRQFSPLIGVNQLSCVNKSDLRNRSNLQYFTVSGVAAFPAAWLRHFSDNLRRFTFHTYARNCCEYEQKLLRTYLKPVRDNSHLYLTTTIGRRILVDSIFISAFALESCDIII